MGNIVWVTQNAFMDQTYPKATILQTEWKNTLDTLYLFFSKIYFTTQLSILKTSFEN